MIVWTNDLLMPDEDQRMIKAKCEDQFKSAMGDLGVKNTDQ